MKKGLLALVLAVTTAVNSFSYETDKFKFIPQGMPVRMYDADNNKIIDFYWWDKNKDNYMQPEEVFIDLNQDGIPDVSYKDLIKMYELREIVRKGSV